MATRCALALSAAGLASSLGGSPRLVHAAPEAPKVATPAQLWDVETESAALDPAVEHPPRHTVGGDPKVTVGALLQTRIDVGGGGARDGDVFIRRARVTVDVELTPWLRGRLQPDFAFRPTLLNEAYVEVRVHRLVRFVAGRAGRPFSLVDAIRAEDILPIERGATFLRRRTLDFYRMLEEISYRGRSTGVQLQGESQGWPVNVSYAFGFFRGATAEEGPDLDIKQVAGRAALHLRSDVRVGFAFSSARLPCAACVTPQSRRGEAFNLDVSHGRRGKPGFLVVAEAGTGELDPSAGANFLGAQLWLAHHSRPLADQVHALEPLLRASFGDPEGSRDPFGGLLLTTGLNVYLVDQSRLMFNHDVWFPQHGHAVHSLKVMVQLFK